MSNVDTSSPLRRSNRRGKSKSALELLGIAPAKDKKTPSSPAAGTKPGRPGKIDSAAQRIIDEDDDVATEIASTESVQEYGKGSGDYAEDRNVTSLQSDTSEQGMIDYGSGDAARNIKQKSTRKKVVIASPICDESDINITMVSRPNKIRKIGPKCKRWTDADCDGDVEQPVRDIKKEKKDDRDTPELDNSDDCVSDVSQEADTLERLLFTDSESQIISAAENLKSEGSNEEQLSDVDDDEVGLESAFPAAVDEAETEFDPSSISTNRRVVVRNVNDSCGKKVILSKCPDDGAETVMQELTREEGELLGGETSENVIMMPSEEDLAEIVCHDTSSEMNEEEYAHVVKEAQKAFDALVKMTSGKTLPQVACEIVLESLPGLSTEPDSKSNIVVRVVNSSELPEELKVHLQMDETATQSKATSVQDVPPPESARNRRKAKNPIAIKGEGAICAPITNLDLNGAALSSSGLRARPVPQIVMTKELQEMAKKLKPSDCMECHVDIKKDAAGKKVSIKCKYCAAIVKDRHEFRKHIKRHPEVVFKPWTCPICYYKADIRAGIVRHLNVHSDIKPYTCTECGKGFSFKQKLHIHMKYHADIRDYQCPECEFAFHEFKTLKMHLRTIHRRTSFTDVMKGHSTTPIRMRVLQQERGLVQLPNGGPAMDGRESAAKEVDEASEEMAAASDGTESEHADTETKDSAVPFVISAAEQGADGMQVFNVVDDVDPSELEEVAKQVSQLVKEHGGRLSITKLEKVDRNDQETNTFVTPEVAATETLSHTNNAKSAAGRQGTNSYVATGEKLKEAGSNTVSDHDTSLKKKTISKVASAALRRSRLYGTRKTEIFTSKYRQGLIPTNEFGQLKNRLEAKPRPPVIIDSKTGKRKRFVNNQRCTKLEQIEPELRRYCDINTNPEKHKVLFKCKLCQDKEFPSKTQFCVHLESQHTDIKAWKCRLCGHYSRLRSSLAVHMKIHTGEKSHSCHICGKTFMFRTKFNIHMRHHENIRPFKCPICSKMFVEQHERNKHMRKVHTDDRPHICPTCNKGFKDNSQLKRHMETHDDTKSYLCELCNKFYRSKSSLCQHMKSHTCMFHCEICNKDFGSYSGFMAHKVMHDESYEGFRCEFCDKILHTKGSLSRHRIVCHTDERPFECPLCCKRFKTKKDVKNHQLVHMTEKKHICSICNFASKRVEALRIHMRRHADVKPYQCGVCGKEYTQKNALEIHLRHHSGHYEGHCDICQRPFSSKYQMEQHIRKKHLPRGDGDNRVDNEQSMTVFMCEECNSVFLTQESLAVHILAEHMKQGWVGGLEVSDSAIKSEESSLEAPESNVGVSTETEKEETEETNREVFPGHEAMESIVRISNPGSSQDKLVSLIHPVEQNDVQVESIEVAKGDRVMESSNGSVVAFTDPSTNEEYVVTVPSSAFETLLAATEAGSEVAIEMPESQEDYMSVAETVEVSPYTETTVTDS